MPDTAITIPRIEGETSRAFAARVEYITAGSGRSLERLRQRYGKTTAYTRQLEQWSSRYNWVDHARRYDDTLASIATQDAADAYLAELESHRKRYGDMGKALYSVACRLLHSLDQMIGAPAGAEVTPQTLTIIARAVVVAADLEAHALRVTHLLERLDADADSAQ